MANVNDNQSGDRATKRGSESASADATEIRNFIKTHDVTRVTRKATPGSGEESADLIASGPDGPAN